MIDERMALIELVEKQADGDLVHEILTFAAERIMELEVKARTGTAKGARSPLREVQRNGCQSAPNTAPSSVSNFDPSGAREIRA